MKVEEVIKTLIKEVNIDEIVIRTYIQLLLNNGKMSLEELRVDKWVIDKLIEYGMCIEIDKAYQALHPRFALTNLYKMYLVKEDKVVNRNVNIDKVATILEGLMERMSK